MTVDDIKWILFLRRKKKLLVEGFKQGKVKFYDEELYSNLRKYYFGGMPLSILILHSHLANGYCYDRGTMIPYGFLDDDFEIVEGNVDSIKLNPEYIRQYKSGNFSNMYADHCFCERTSSDGTVWVYDTSEGMIVEKELYYKIEHPEVRLRRTKGETLAFMEDQIKDHVTDDKYVLPLVLPMLEDALDPIQDWYLEDLKVEIEQLKKTVDYKSICQEMPSFRP